MDTIFLYALNVAPLDADSAVWAAFVCADRRARMASLKNIADRRRSLGAELALHAALSRHMDGYAPPPVYDRLPGGKPVLRDARGWHISLAHAGDWAVCALHRAPVGVESYLKLTGEGLAGGFRTLCAGETEVFRLGQRMACLCRAEVGDCLLCAATDAPAALKLEIVAPPEP